MRGLFVFFRRMVERVRQLNISAKITVAYAIVLFVVVLSTSILTAAGIYYTLYHQASVELEISIRHTMNRISRGDPFDDNFLREDTLLPGVVLRVTDVTGRVILENVKHYPSIERVESHIQSDPSFLSDPSMMIADFKNARIYYTKRQVMRNGEVYELHFFKTITTEKRLLHALLWVLFMANLLGLFLALVSGFIMSRKVLQPIRTLIQMTKRVEVENMDSRIRIPDKVHGDELTELAGTFNRMMDRLQQGFSQQQRFVSDASHELRTPVTVILGYSDLLSRWGREDMEILDEGISSIRSEAENMQKLIEKLLFLARADQKRQVLRMEQMELSTLVADVVKKMKLIAVNHQVELLQNDKGVVQGDAVILRQMMRIFLENSLKYTPSGGRIVVSSVQEGEEIHLTIEDNGIGIAEEDQKKVFERFYRVDSSRTKAEGGVSGTGLGLSIAKWIAEQHGIEISMESSLGVGTRIHLRIPLLQQEEDLEV